MTARQTALLAICLVLAGPARSEGAAAILQGLDKVTARIFSFEAPIDSPVRFGTLNILVRYCRTRPPEEPADTTAFREIDEMRPGEHPARLFSGWMFASSPALSSLEHPTYDVWVVGCKTSSIQERATSR